MEFCNGGTLIDLIEERKKQKLFFEEWEIKELFTSILKGMQYIRIFMEKEKKNMVLMHRDLKPDNFFFTNKENNQKILKIGDFGIAKTHRPPKSALSSAGTNKHFQSPEVSVAGNITDKTDIWMLGINLYYMCFFEYPWDTNFTEYQIFEFQKNYLDGHHFDFDNKKRDITKEMKYLLNRMLRFNPDDRITFEDLFQHQFFSFQLGIDKRNLKHLEITENNEEDEVKRAISMKEKQKKINNEHFPYNSAIVEQDELDKEFCLYLESLDRPVNEMKKKEKKRLKFVDENEERKMSEYIEERKTENEENDKMYEEENKEENYEEDKESDIFKKKPNKIDAKEEKKSNKSLNLEDFQDPSFMKLKNKIIFLEYFDDQIKNFKFPNNDEIPNKNIVRFMIQKIRIAIILNGLKKLEEYDDQHKKSFINNLLNKSIMQFHQMQKIVLREIEELSTKCCNDSCCCCCCCSYCGDENTIFYSKIRKNVDAILYFINPQINKGTQKYEFLRCFGELLKIIFQKMQMFKNRNQIAIEQTNKNENFEVLNRNIFILINLEKFFHDMKEKDAMAFNKEMCQIGFL